MMKIGRALMRRDNRSMLRFGIGVQRWMSTVVQKIQLDNPYTGELIAEVPFIGHEE
jgi:hypothetical protein